MSFARFVLAALLFVLSVVAIASLVSGPANATPPIGVLASMPASVGFVDSYLVACTTTATSISPSTMQPLSVECFAPEPAETAAAVFVGVGDSGLADPAFATRTSPVICGTGCNKNSIKIEGKNAFCRADTGTVNLFCVATTGSSS